MTKATTYYTAHIPTTGKDGKTRFTRVGALFEHTRKDTGEVFYTFKTAFPIVVNDAGLDPGCARTALRPFKGLFRPSCEMVGPRRARFRHCAGAAFCAAARGSGPGPPGRTPQFTDPAPRLLRVSGRA